MDANNSDLPDINEALTLASDSHELLFPLPCAGNVKLRSRAVCGEVVQKMQEQDIFMDTSRRQLVDEIAPIVYDMGRGKLEGLGHCAVMAGPRGIGKTCFLKAFMAAARAKFPTVFCCYLNYKAGSHVRPIAFFFGELFRQQNRPVPDKLPGPKGLAIWLEKHQISVLFVVDDVDAVYRLPASEGDPIIQELIAIGQFDEPRQKRRFMAVVTGSNLNVLRLCFAGLPANERADYPSYCGLDFNDRKYFILPLTSIQTGEEFVEALKFFRGSEDANTGDSKDDNEGDSERSNERDETERDPLDTQKNRDLFEKTRGVAQAITAASSRTSHRNTTSYQMRMICTRYGSRCWI